MEQNKLWFEEYKIKEALENKQEVGLVYFIEELNITIKSYENMYIIEREHESGLNDNKITTLKEIMSELESYEKPDILFIDSKEVKII